MTPDNDLQLERAEFDQAEARTSCAMCARPLERRYFQVNGQSVCTLCCGRVKAQLAAGSPMKRALLALVAGVGAAAVGSIVYYAILALTGYEFALIAIVVGLLVGKAVNWGANGRGGWLYQTMAIALTYLSIVSAYVPLIVAEVRKGAAIERTQSDLQPEPPDAAQPQTPAVPVSAAAADPDAAAQDASVSVQRVSIGRVFLAVGVLIALVLAAPFLGGLENIIGLIIIGIGLLQAWKMNRRHEVVITGPHAIAPPVALRQAQDNAEQGRSVAAAAPAR